MNPTVRYTLEDQERMTKARNYFAWQHRLVTQELGQRVIEVGCGIGNFTRLLFDREAVLALDSEIDCVEHLKRRFPNQGNLRALTCDVTNRAFANLVSFRADSCICLNVLEHIEDDRSALSLMSHVLVPGGTILLLVPAFPTLYGPIDQRLGHYRRYTRKSISTLTRSVGLRVKKVHYLNAIGFFGWWMNARIMKRDAQSSVQIELFDKFIVPLSSRLETRITPPFGQSLFAILEKQV